MSVANGPVRGVDPDTQLTLLARSSTQIEALTQYLQPKTEVRERLEQLDFAHSAVLVVGRPAAAGQAMRIVRLVHTGRTLTISAQVWPIPGGVFETGEILFTYDAVKVSKKSLGLPTPRRLIVRVRRVKP